MLIQKFRNSSYVQAINAAADVDKRDSVLTKQTGVSGKRESQANASPTQARGSRETTETPEIRSHPMKKLANPRPQEGARSCDLTFLLADLNKAGSVLDARAYTLAQPFF
jgi:hypothetical protein